MSEKSHVSMEQHVCVVCTKPYDTGAVLLDRELRQSLDRNTITGWGLCAEHRRLFDEGYIALVACDPTRSGSPADGTCLDPAKVYRTGEVAHLRRAVFSEIFRAPVDDSMPCVFVQPEVIEHLKAIVASLG